MVLYRKYRPQKFSEVVGQEHIVKTLTNALKRDILAHGYLFAGPHGTGKTTLARLLAKSLNCQNRKTGQAELASPWLGIDAKAVVGRRENLIAVGPSRLLSEASVVSKIA